MLLAWRAYRSQASNAEGSRSALGIIFKGVPGSALLAQTKRFTWIVVIAPLVLVFAARILNVACMSMGNAISFLPKWVLAGLSFFGEGLFSLFFVAVVTWAAGKARRALLVDSFRRPSLPGLGLAILFPVGIAYLHPLLSYLGDRIHWAAFDFYRFDPPLFATYVKLPSLILLFDLIPALAEEIAWRGYLQPRFIKSYGLVLGVFYTGIVWGAFHFAFDFSSLLSDQAVAVHLVRRLFNTVALSVIFAWSTLRSRSVIPAAVIHGLYNMLLSAGPQYPLAPWTTYAVWLLTGLALFRFWPPQGTGTTDSSAAPDPVSGSASPNSTSEGLVS